MQVPEHAEVPANREEAKKFIRVLHIDLALAAAVFGADTLTGEFVRDVWFDGDVLVRTKIIGSDNSVILSDLR